MYKGSNKYFDATQFWSFDEEELWPVGVYSNDEATPAYFIDIGGVPAELSEGDWVIFSSPIKIVGMFDFIENYSKGEE